MSEVNKQKIINFLQIASEWLILAVIFLIPLCFAAFHEVADVFVLYKMAALRVLIIFIFLTFSAKVLLEKKISYKFSKHFFVMVGLLAASWLLSSFLSDNSGLSFFGSYGRRQGFNTLIFYLLFFLLLIFNLKSFSSIKRLIGVWLLSSAAVCFYGLAQIFNFDPIAWSEPFSLTGRIFSTLGQPNFLSQFLILSIPFCFYAIIFLARRFLIRLLLFVLFFAQFFCLFFTLSRAAALGLAAEIVVAGFFILWIKGKKKIAYILSALLFIITISVGVYFFALPTDNQIKFFLGGRLESVFDLKHGATKARFNYWQAAIAEIKTENLRQKLLGHGPETLWVVFARHYQPGWALDENINVWADSAHNLFFDIILSFGFFGLAAYFLFIFFIFANFLLFIKKAPCDDKFWLAIFCSVALTGYLVNNLFSFSDITGHLFFFLILSILVFLFSQNEKEKEIDFKLTAASSWIIFGALAVFSGIFIFYYSVRPIQADYHYMNAEVKDLGYCPKMVADSREAFVLGGENKIFYQLNYIYTALSCLDEFSDEKEQEKLKDNLLWLIDNLPDENDFNLESGRAWAEKGIAGQIDKSYYSRAEEDYAKMASKYPAVSIVYLDWAETEKAKGDFTTAIKIAEQGLLSLPISSDDNNYLSPHLPEVKAREVLLNKVICNSFTAQGRAEESYECWKKIVTIDPFFQEAYKNLADLSRQKGDFAAAIWYNKKGYLLEPGNYAWPLAIGALYQKIGDQKNASHYYKEVLGLSPDNKEAMDFFGQKEKVPTVQDNYVNGITPVY
jgi:O-antigen ligase/tetratricopeptide (TPR) repeat protein